MVWLWCDYDTGIPMVRYCTVGVRGLTMVWCCVVWCIVLGYAIVVVWCDVVWFRNDVLCSVAWYGSDIVWYGSVRYGTGRLVVVVVVALITLRISSNPWSQDRSKHFCTITGDHS